MGVYQAIYENGVFRPLEPVDLPERTLVTLTVRILPEESIEERERAKIDKVWEILSHGIDTGDPSLSERHNEHQP